MTVDELCVSALNGHIPPNLTIEEEVFCLRMCRLYEKFKRGEMNTESARLEKQKEIKKYNDSIKMREFRAKQTLHTTAMWKEIESTSSAYRLNKTIENVDKLVDAIDGKVHKWKEI